MIEHRFAEGHLERVPVLVNELLGTGIQVLFAANPHVIRAAMHANTAIPIVGIDLETDPVGAGWVKTLARPGGNLTGFFLDIPEFSAKQVEFLMMPIGFKLKPVGFFDRNPGLDVPAPAVHCCAPSPAGSQAHD